MSVERRSEPSKCACRSVLGSFRMSARSMPVHYGVGAATARYAEGMRQAVTSLTVQTRRGLTDVTDRVQEIVRAQKLTTGLCTIFLRHTSASLVIQENAD